MLSCTDLSANGINLTFRALCWNNVKEGGISSFVHVDQRFPSVIFRNIELALKYVSVRPSEGKFRFRQVVLDSFEQFISNESGHEVSYSGKSASQEHLNDFKHVMKHVLMELPNLGVGVV